MRLVFGATAASLLFTLVACGAESSDEPTGSIGNCSCVVSRPESASGDLTERYVIGTYEVLVCSVNTAPEDLATPACEETWKKNNSRFPSITPYITCDCSCVQTMEACDPQGSTQSG